MAKEYIDKNNNCKFFLKTNNFSFTTIDEMIGYKSFSFGVEISNHEEIFINQEPESNVEYFNNVKDGIKFILQAKYSKIPLKEIIEFTLLSQRRILIIDRKITNFGKEPVNIYSFKEGIIDSQGGILLGDIHPYDTIKFAHMDNVRWEVLPYSRGEYPYLRSLPTELKEVNNGEAQPFPAIYLFSEGYGNGLVEASLDEGITRRFWKIKAKPLLKPERLIEKNSCVEVYYGIREFKRKEGYLLLSGKELKAGAVLYQIKSNCHIQDAYLDYIDILKDRHKLGERGKCSLYYPRYCTWNYGVFKNIDENSVLTRARIISEKLSNIKYLQIDDGYQKGDNSGIGEFYPNPKDNYNMSKFPSGMRNLSSQIKELALIPCIWLGFQEPRLKESKLLKEHPDWFLKNENGEIYQLCDTAFLDLAVKGSRDYLESIFKTLFSDWGFEGIKLDFWSYAFENKEQRFSTGFNYEWREWLLETIRKFLPEKGLLEICSTTGMGNLFLAKYADIYREGIDIDIGLWDYHKRASSWTLPLLSIPGRDTFLMNVDGLGIHHALSEKENLSRLTWGFITQGALEIDGKLEDLSEDDINNLNKITENCDRGYRCLCADEETFYSRPFPRILYVDYPEDSLWRKKNVKKHVAFFNWTDYKEFMGITLDRLGLTGNEDIMNFWTDEKIKSQKDSLSFILEPHESKLLTVKDLKSGLGEYLQVRSKKIVVQDAMDD